MFSVLSTDPKVSVYTEAHTSSSPSVPILPLAPGHVQILTSAGNLWSCQQRQLRAASDYTLLPQAQWQGDAGVLTHEMTVIAQSPCTKRSHVFPQLLRVSRKKI